MSPTSEEMGHPSRILGWALGDRHGKVGSLTVAVRVWVAAQPASLGVVMPQARGGGLASTNAPDRVLAFLRATRKTTATFESNEPSV